MSERPLPPPKNISRGPDNSLVLGATRLAWMYGKSRKWASRLLRLWAEQQAHGGPVRVFLGPGNGLFTTLAIVHQHMPPGRDLVLYRRVEGIETELADAHRRIDRTVVDVEELKRRVGRVEQRRAG